MNSADLARIIEHTNVSPNALPSDIDRLCEEALKYNFYAVVVPPIYVNHAKNRLKGSGVKVVAVVGFPWGNNPTASKVAETRYAVKNGADEIDMVMNRSWLKSGDYRTVMRDIRAVIKAAGKRPVKVILETSDLTEEEKVEAIKIAVKAGASHIKTSTGYGINKGGATVEDVRLIRKLAGPSIGIKASGGIKRIEDAVRLVEAGATRIGTSRGVELIEQKIVEDLNY
ncbi:MAG: deoxyribose-phosphate aldolase [Nitrososphaerota archaeon]